MCRRSWSTVVCGGWLLVAAGHASGQAVTLRPPEVPADATPVLVPQLGHNTAVLALGFQPGGRLLASGSWDGTILLWDTDSEFVVGLLHSPAGLVRDLTFSGDGRLLAGTTFDGAVVLWDVERRELKTVLSDGHQGQVVSAAFSPDGGRLASVGEDAGVVLWDLATGTVQRRLEGHRQAVHGVAFSPDGAKLATGAKDGQVLLWDLSGGEPKTLHPAGEELRSSFLKGYDCPADVVAFSPDGSLVAAGCEPRAVLLWDATTGQAVRQLQAAPGRDPRWAFLALGFSADGSKLAAADASGAVSAWTVADGTGLGQVREAQQSYVIAAALSPDRPLAALGNYTGIVDLAQLEGGQTSWPTGLSREWSPAVMLAGCASADGRVAAVPAEMGRRVAVLDVPGRRALRVVDAGPPGAEGAPPMALHTALSPDGRWLAASTMGPGTASGVLLYDLSAEGPPARLPVSTSGFTFGPDGSLLVTVDMQQVRFWDTTTLQPVATWRIPGDAMPAAGPAYSGDGRRLALGRQDGTVVVWEIVTGEVVATLQPDRAGGVGYPAVALSDDGKLVAHVAPGFQVEVAEVDTGRVLRRLGGGGTTAVLVFSQDASKLLAGDLSGQVRLWDVPSGEALSTFQAPGPSGSVPGLAFTSDGRGIVAAGTLAVVEARAYPVPEKTLQGHTRQLIALAPDAAGRTCAVAAAGKVLQFDLATGAVGGLLTLPRGATGGLDLTALAACGDTALAAAGDGRQVGLWDARDGSVKWSAVETERQTCLAYLPTSRLVASAGPGGRITLRAAADGQVRQVLQAHPTAARCVAMGARSATTATGWADGTITLSGSTDPSPHRSWQAHQGAVTAVASSPDGRSLASSGEDGHLTIWDPATGQAGQELETGGAAVAAVLYSPDGSQLLAGLETGEIGFWDAATGEPAGRLEGAGSPVTALAVDAAGSTLAVGLSDGTVRLVALPGRNVQRSFGDHAGPVTCLAFSDDGTLLASGSADKSVRLWSVADGTRLALFAGHTDAVTWVGFVGGSRDVLSASRDGSVRRWQHGVPVVLAAEGDRFEAVTFSADGRYLVAGSTQERLFLWPAGAGEGEPPVVAACPAAVVAIAARPGGKWVAAGCREGSLLLWAMPGRQAPVQVAKASGGVRALAFGPNPDLLAAANGLNIDFWVIEGAERQPTARLLTTFEARNGFVDGLAFSPDGTLLAAATSNHQVIVWDVAAAAPRYTLEGHTSSATAVALSPDGHLLASGARDGGVILWNVATGEPGRALEVPRTQVNRVAFSPDGRTVTAATTTHGLVSWDVATGQQVADLAVAGTLTSDFAYQPAGSTVAVATARQVLVWDDRRIAGEVLTQLDSPVTGAVMAGGFAVALHDGRIMSWNLTHESSRQGSTTRPDFRSSPNAVSRPGHDITCLAVAPDGRTLAAGSADQTIVLWDSGHGTPTRTIGDLGANVSSLAFSPRDGRLAAGLADRRILLWDSPQAPEPRTLEGHTAWVGSLAFTPDGKVLASGSGDSTVRLWNAATGEPLAVLEGSNGAVNGLAFVAGGARLLGASADGCLRLWRTDGVLDGRQPALIATLISLDDGQQWLATTPSGYYDCSLDASRYVSWQLGPVLLPCDQLEAQFHRPDLLRQALAGQPIAAARGLDAQWLPPRLTFTQPAYGAEVQGDTVHLQLAAAGQRPVQRVSVTTNGVPLPAETAARLIPDQPETELTLDLDLPLPRDEARVRLRAVAYDTAQLRSDVAELVLYRPGAKASAGRLQVLCLGINQYQDPRIPTLHFAVPDAVALGGAFAEQGDARPYSQVASTVLTDDSATLSKVRFALDRLKTDVTENDVVVIFLSGHGLRDEQGGYYYVTADTDLSRLAETALNWEELVAALRQIRGRRVLILADTCQSEGIIDERGRTSDALVTKLNQEAQRMVFTACRRDEASLALPKWEHGAFTQAILAALVGAADDDQDGHITFAELRSFVVRRVPEMTNDRQHPQMPFLERDFEPDAVFARALYTNR